MRVPEAISEPILWIDDGSGGFLCRIPNVVFVIGREASRYSKIGEGNRYNIILSGNAVLSYSIHRTADDAKQFCYNWLCDNVKSSFVNGSN